MTTVLHLPPLLVLELYLIIDIGQLHTLASDFSKGMAAQLS